MAFRGGGYCKVKYPGVYGLCLRVGGVVISAGRGSYDILSEPMPLIQ